MMFENAIVIVLIILIINVVYVTFSTIRMILTLKGRRYLAAFVSTFEVVIYIIGLGLVLDNLNAIQNIIAYAVGYAIGIIVGSKIEEKLALGYITVNVVSSNPDIQFTKKLRDQGYGVTSWTSHGMEGDRVSMQILTPRKYELQLYESIKQLDPKAFIISYEPKRIHGGFWVKQVRSGRLLRRKSGDQTVANSEPNGQSSSNISVGDLSAHATPTPLVGEVQAEVKQENDQEQSKE